jgi:hypothetical protein
MFNRIIVIVLTLLPVVMWILTFALIAPIGNLAPRIDAAIEAVAIIEDAAQHIQDDMQILRNIADEQQCYENQGEWTTSHGCVLEIVQ